MPLFQYQVKAEPVFSGKERTSPDKYGPQDYAPRANWNRRTSIAAVVLAINTAFAFVPVAPFAETVSIDKWHPVANTPRWDKTRSQYLHPASILGDVPRAEGVSVDRWHPEIEKPRWNLKRQQHTFPYLFLGDIPRAEPVSIDRWHPNLARPRWDAKRTQYLYPAAVPGDIPRAEAPSVGAWHPQTERPRLDRSRRQYLFPVSVLGDISRTEDASVASWHPAIECPRFDLKREQWKFPSLFYADIPRAEAVSLDRWHAPLEQPRRVRVQPIFESGVNNPYPIPNAVTPVPFDWLQPIVDPFRSKAQIIGESSAFVYPVAVTPFDWQAQQPGPIRKIRGIITDRDTVGIVPVVPFDWNRVNQEANQARLRPRRPLIVDPIVTQGEFVFVDKWEPQLRYRLWGQTRRDYLYQAFAFGTDYPIPNEVFVDSWIPAQVYQRPLVIPIYWIAYGEVNLVIPGTHMPCILQADAVLVQPVCYCALLVPSEENYCATLIQPVGYCAEEIACEL